MKRATIVGATLGLVALVSGLAFLANGDGDRRGEVEILGAATPRDSTATPSATHHQGFLYGRVTTGEGAVYEGRLRWGGGEEAFWSDYFNGVKDENSWAAHVPPERLEESVPIEIFGIRIAERTRRIDLRRPFMARFGDITRIEADGRRVLVTLKSGTLFDLDRLNADDLADGLRVWDAERGALDFHEIRIRSVELLATPPLAAVPDRLHGTVRTRQGDFTGFVQWNRRQCVGTDRLVGRTADGEIGVRFDTIRSIERDARTGSTVTLLDGREIGLSGTSDVGEENQGIFVDDRRYGRVLVSWETFERVDFSPGGGGPAFGDYPRGSPLTGSVTTRDGRRLAGRLVYDLDESETTETLDAPLQGVNYTIPFGLIASIELPAGQDNGSGKRGGGVPARREIAGEAAGRQLARLVLHSGEELALERRGDLGRGNAGVLVFVDGRERPEYVPWTDVGRLDLDRPSAMYPPLESD